MADNFDRAPGAGRGRGRGSSGGQGPQEGGRIPAMRGAVGVAQPKLRPPMTTPPVVECTISDSRKLEDPRGTQDKFTTNAYSAAVVKTQKTDCSSQQSQLSVNAPEFYPQNYQSSADSGNEDDQSLNFVQRFLHHLTEQPGSFEGEIDSFTATVNKVVTTEKALRRLVECIYQQATSITNFSYTGARLCNHLSHHLAISPQSGNFRQLLLLRCQTEYEKRNQAAKGDEATRKQFHAFVLFLGELYLHLEIKGTKDQMTRAEILQIALLQLLKSLFSHPFDSNVICAVKLLKLTGSVLEDALREKGKADMDDIIQTIEDIILDADCSRDVKYMLLKLVELRSSNWGRIYTVTTNHEATPENDPNYFMNEPTFYTSEGIPFTADDPDYQEKYQDLLDHEYMLHGYYENGTDPPGGGDSFSCDEDEMDPEIAEAYEKFCLECEQRKP
ncbi:polyadenylate-binding protein-interacting protein 1 [Protopterus annectens]|uniref:polyadenylate-binding protein-interacting protein 1 n=1 Tax=Protopterus annectens TaxID=7888 RepID=UPI001CFB893A|nr:polyadenylate-binding protein-interacting protein 1 [Protopterus annectens]